MKAKAMGEALKNRKAQGIDLTIIIGDTGEDKDSKIDGLAPDAEVIPGKEDMDLTQQMAPETMPGMMEPHPDAAQDAELFKNELAKLNMGRDSLAAKSRK